jgi:hypothetical protein
LLTEKSLGIPAIREDWFLLALSGKAKIRGIWADLAASLCQASLFHIDENSALESRAPDSQNDLSGGESAPGG